MMAERGGRYALAVELGCGTGRFTPALASASNRVIATDPSPGMIDFCRQNVHLSVPGEFREAAAEDVVLSGVAGRADLVGAFWSLTYPIQSFFALTLTPAGQIVQRVSNREARRKAEAFIEGLTQIRDFSRAIVAIVFTPDSVEQRWITGVWSSIGPLPGGSRDVAWDLLQARGNQLVDEGHTSATECASGNLICPDETELKQVFLDHHLRGLLPQGATRKQLEQKLIRDMAPYRCPEGYRIPAGFRWLSFKLNGRAQA